MLNFILGITVGIIFGWFVACWCMATIFANTLDRLEKDQHNMFDEIVQKHILHRKE